jgi:phosphatidylglycerophosphatase A
MILLLKKWIALGFGSGLSPWAPGTVGSVMALGILHVGITFFGLHFIWPFTLVSIILSLWVADEAEAAWGKDPAQMVIDEWAGMGLSLGPWAFFILFLNYPMTNYWIDLVMLFTLFRLFDIWKPLGISSMQNISGGFGILADDLLAGVYAGFLWFLIQTLLF